MPTLPVACQKYLVALFDQGDEIARRLESLTAALQTASSAAEREQITEARSAAIRNAGGICQSLCLKWVRKKIREKSRGMALTHEGDAQKAGTGRLKPEARMTDLRDDATMAKAIARQDEASAKLFVTMVLAEGINSYHLNKCDQGMILNPRISEAATKITGTTQQCFLFGFNCPALEGAGHVIAMYTSSGKAAGFGKHVYLFDPNFGELKIPKGEFNPFLRSLLLGAYGTTDKDTTLLETFYPKG
jgi:hypothetical protein